MGNQSVSEDFRDFLTGDLAEDVAGVQADYEVYLSSLPPRVRQAVTPFSPKNVFMSSGKLSVLALPFWVGEALNVEREMCRRISLANFFGLLHFVVQDNITDGNWNEGDLPDRVISGTLFQQQMFVHYQHCFPPQSSFWSLLEKYWLEWAGSIAWERQAGPYSPFSEEDLLRAARKAAPLKVCPSGLALLSGREDLIPDLERAVDMMHMVMIMADDLVDVAEDLAGNRFNTLLSTLVSTLSLDPQERPDINWIGRRVFIDRVDEIHLQRMWAIAEEAQALLGQIGLTQWAELITRTVQGAEQWRDQRLRDIIALDLNEILEIKSQEQQKPIEDRAVMDIDQLLSDLASMRKIYPDYSPSTAREIVNAIPQAYNLHCTEGGRWGRGFIARVVPINSTTVGRYLKAFRENKLTEVNGIPIP